LSREAAKKIIETVQRHTGEQNNVLLEIQPLCTEDEFSTYKQMIGRSMGEMFVEVIVPIMREYPDLTPPELVPPRQKRT
jgi:hypothetical protein